MSLNAHPYVVLAEQQWKLESLGRANIASDVQPRSAPRSPVRRLHWFWDRVATHAPRPV
ncbi:hypothetical protein [Pedococcus sp. 5OH_020]|uniref:hypothetical protein n=1 Tax=Pedococcus sp. 5OH_020 TaxID=2989814 RepID=UPI0022E9C15D|nr:hypothetical protein [Pedococcus sp. 5OH_020]